MWFRVLDEDEQIKIKQGVCAMWTRRELKEYAKQFLKKNYWNAFIVCLLVALLSGSGLGTNNADVELELNNTDSIVSEDVLDINSVDLPFSIESDHPVVTLATRRFQAPVFLFGFFVGAIVLAILTIAISYVLQVGQSRFFLRGFDGDVQVKHAFSPFNSDEYVPIVKTQFLKGVYIFFWYLAFLVPGIIKTYEYRFVPYILAENSSLPTREVLELSRKMTHGHKMNIFILDLSFWGWYLLGGLFFGIGNFFVNPYAEATNARLYTILSGRDESEKRTSVSIES